MKCLKIRPLHAALLITLIFQASAYSQVPLEPAEGTLYTSDNVAIAYEHFKKGFDTVVIICPGFYNSKENRWMQKTVDLVASHHDVIIFDFRGHGKSKGKYTWSAKEHLDVNAVIDYAKTKGYRRIGILAFSLGAASAVNAVSERNDIDSMILISCPTSFKMVDYHFWEPGMWDDLFDNIACGWEGKGAETDNIFIHKTKPIDTIDDIKETPILFIHGTNDWVIDEKHSKKLFNAAVGPKKLEIIKGGLHAERMVQKSPESMNKLIDDWFNETLK